MEVVLFADVIGTDCPAPLGDGKADVERAFRIPGAADKLGGTPQVLDCKRPPQTGQRPRLSSSAVRSRMSSPITCSFASTDRMPRAACCGTL